MRNPPGEEQRGRRRSGIGRVDPGRTEIVADVVERHEDHDDATEQVD
jgi:hypothetical protein